MLDPMAQTESTATAAPAATEAEPPADIPTDIESSHSSN